MPHGMKQISEVRSRETTNLRSSDGKAPGITKAQPRLPLHTDDTENV